MRFLDVRLLVVVIIAIAAWLWFVPSTDATLRKLLIGICVVLTIIWVIGLVFSFT